jgi:Ca-activated chloride channel family protein
MNVANILPGDVVRVELRYTELLVPEGGVYEFAHPTVVGPRYSNRLEAQASPDETWTQNPYLKKDRKVPYSFDFAARLVGGMPIAEVTSPSHRIVTDFDGPDRARVRLDPAEKGGGNRDFILRYRLADRKIEAGLLLQKGREENFFLLMVQPPKRAAAVVVPREYVFVVDVSGSMHGYPLDTAKALLHQLVGSLTPSDRFNLVLFAGSAQVLGPSSLAATAENVKMAVELLDRASGGGGTELLPALKTALALPQTEGVARSIVLVTDGHVDVEREVFDLVRDSLDRASLFPFGIGTSVNRFLIEGLARVGRGEAFVVAGPDQAEATAYRFREYISAPLLVDVETVFDGLAVYDVDPPKIPDLFAERPLVVFGKWRGAAGGTITLRGKAGDASWAKTIDVAREGRKVEGGALAYLWARERIALLSDYGQLRPGARSSSGLAAFSSDEKSAIVELGLQYNLLTRHTSFVAVDSEVRRQGGELRSVKQPLPIPQGVPEQAVGGVPTTPEPETWMLLGVVVAALGWFIARRGLA